MSIIGKPLLLIILLIQFGCSGYRPALRRNPFASLGIHSLSIPQFVNNSIFPAASGDFTKEIIRLLSEYPELKITIGEDNSTDAMLIGILDSKQKKRDALTPEGHKLTSGALDQSLGERKNLSFPTSSSYGISLRLILIKAPTSHELALVKSSLVQYVVTGPKIMFNNIFELNGRYTHAVNSNNHINDAGILNFTKTHKNRELSMKGLAESMAANFKGVVLNAF